ncbi:MAG: hybrid sensor histidine kinase/response regulator [Nitrospinae bacterium]|nr:hybrid sensor histidine kinase/response regulator [Nitrospinota bacterium]
MKGLLWKDVGLTAVQEYNNFFLTATMAFDKTKFYAKFVEDSKEQLEEINNILVELESGEVNDEHLDLLLRLLHTLKGSSKMLGFKHIGGISHKLEDVFIAYKEKSIKATKPLFNLMFKALDAVTEILCCVEESRDIDFNHEPLCEELEKAAQGELKEPEKSQPETKEAKTVSKGKLDKSKFILQFVSDAWKQLEEIRLRINEFENTGINDQKFESLLRLLHTMKGSSKMLGFVQIGNLVQKLEGVFLSIKKEEVTLTSPLYKIFYSTLDVVIELMKDVEAGKEITYDPEPLCEILIEASKGNVAEDINKVLLNKGNTEKDQEEEKVISVKKEELSSTKKAEMKTTETIRVDTEKLDESIRLLGEMVSSQQRFKQNLFEIEKEVKSFNNFIDLVKEGENLSELNRGLEEIYQKFKGVANNIKDNLNYQNILENELREKVLHLRMMPISTVLNTFKRMVRDIGASSGKEVEFTIDGGHTELDKKIVEGINDPLLHIIRNCIDHGIETPDERIKAGKHPTGKLNITAEYEGGSALIKIKDDGRGIALEKIKEKALKINLYTAEQLNEMSDKDILNIIFLPGFSTSKIITDISGRGVGMDVVRENIVKKMKGGITIDTKEGEGSTFNIRLPMTLSIMRLLMFSVAGKPFGITVNSIYEILHVEKDQIIDVVNKKAVKLRDQFIPVIELDSLLKVKSEDKEYENSIVLILYLGDEKLGILVHNLIDELDVEIKTLPNHMKNNELIFGVTITGKNEVVLVLNANSIIQVAKRMKEGTTQVSAKRKKEKQFFILVVDDSVSTREIEKSILESYGYSVDIAGDGLEGLQKAEHTNYDLIITDVEMPRLDGFSFTEKLRAEKNYETTPIIIVSSRDSDEDKRRGIEVGADAYIIKGEFEQSNLMETVQCLLY